jgi:carboxylesterase type B
MAAQTRVSGGVLRGRPLGGGAAAFLGVPYAAPPVGVLRFAPPRPAAPWTGVREATRPGPAAAQPPARPSPLPPPSGEVDESGCLTLNVWTPDLAGSRAVLVWIHGGGYSVGSGGWSRHDGAQLSRAGDIVVVTINYRLGALGYLYLAGITDGMGAGNFGLLDQMAALRWVRENIAALGGDPGAVTVAGQSAGAMSCALLLATPAARGSVRRAVLASPPLTSLTGTDEATRVAAAYVDVLGLDQGSLHELRRLPWQQLVHAHQQLLARGPIPDGPLPAFGPVLGGSGVAEPPLSVSARGELGSIDILAGSTRDEQNLFDPAPPVDRDRPTVLRMLRPWFGDGSSEAYLHYLRRRPGASPGVIANAAIGFASFERATIALLEDQARAGNPGFLYRFDWQSPARNGTLGAPHAIDLPFLFGNPAIWQAGELLRGADPAVVRALTASFQHAVAAFVRTGSPGDALAPDWSPYQPTTRATMRYDTVIECVGDLAGGQRCLVRPC